MNHDDETFFLICGDCNDGLDDKGEECFTCSGTSWLSEDDISEPWKDQC